MLGLAGCRCGFKDLRRAALALVGAGERRIRSDGGPSASAQLVDGLDREHANKF